MPESLPILVVEDDVALLEAVCDTLELAGYRLLRAAGGAHALQLLAQQPVSLVVSDVRMLPVDGIALLREIRRRWPHLPVVLMTAFAEVDRAVEAMRLGACDFLLKPFEPPALLAVVQRYRLPDALDAAGVIASDASSRSLFALARRVAQAEATVLLTGESGTGKEVVARFIHQHSARCKGPFVAINCAAIPDTLLESTLFGHEKGAFSGAQHAQAGKFEQANGGTLLLDEITEMPLALQAKLLRVLQEREVERVGGKQPIALDLRVIATSNRDIGAAVAAGQFREDLYYRLNVFPLAIPALRERVDDIVPLARHLLAVLGGRAARPALRLSAEAESALRAYAWPGNVRELENVIQRAVILAPSEMVDVEALRLASTAVSPPVERGESLATASAPPPAATERRNRTLLDREREHILQTLAEVGGSQKLAAERLGMPGRTLRYKLRQYRQQGFLGG